MNTLSTVIVPADVLAEHAESIRALRSRIVSDVAEIGCRLTQVKVIVGHGNWLPWLDREFGWSEDTAERFIRVHEFVEGLSNSASVRNLILTLPVSAVYLLAAPSTPVEARDAIIERAEAGEPVSVADVKHAIGHFKSDRKAPGPKGEKRKMIEAALKTDPTKSNHELAALADVTFNYINKVRRLPQQPEESSIAKRAATVPIRTSVSRFAGTGKCENEVVQQITASLENPPSRPKTKRSNPIIRVWDKASIGERTEAIGHLRKIGAVR
jgi:hypothetical protein